jgi:hypothetical protein
MKYLKNLEKLYLPLLGDARFFGEAEVGMPPELMMTQDKTK